MNPFVRLVWLCIVLAVGFLMIGCMNIWNARAPESSGFGFFAVLVIGLVVVGILERRRRVKRGGA